MKRVGLFAYLLFIYIHISAQYASININKSPYPENKYSGTYIVGKINGNISIQPNGVANYSIPIVIPEGAGGLTPKLSIDYNSLYGDGILGQGFYLEGLSKITRAPSSYIVDNIIAPVSLTASDKFSLDGNRLISNPKSYGQFYVELNDNSIVTTETPEKPTSFTVKTGDGTIKEYGGSVDSRIMGQIGDSDKTLYWLLNKVTDSNGNYYTITYEQFSNGDYVPIQIDYTGNELAGLETTHCVKFIYTNRNITNIYCINESKIQTTHLLTEIQVYFGDTQIKAYSLGYDSTTNPLLTSISEKNHKNIAIYKPTTFEWYNTDDNSSVLSKYETINDLKKVDFNIGDFNGDGRMDFIATPNSDNSDRTQWGLYLANEAGGFTFANSGEVLEGFLNMLVGDFNADGKDDVIQVRQKSKPYTNYFLYISTGNDLEYYGAAVATEQTEHEALIGDLNGDKATDLCIFYSDKTSYKTVCSLLQNNKITPLKTVSSSNNALNKWDIVRMGDFNGDGLSDVINVFSEGTEILVSNGSGLLLSKDTSTWPTSDHHLYFGDFNGDGKTDKLATGYKDIEWSNFQVHLSTDVRYERYSIPWYFKSTEHSIAVADINGDGKDDFYALPNEGNSLSAIKSYINDGTGLKFFECSNARGYPINKWNYYFGDFNGDGKTDYLCNATFTNNASWTGYQLFLTPTTTTRLLKTITDGLGLQIKLTYKKSNDNTIHENKTSAEYPIIPMVNPLPLVSEMSVSNGLGGTNSTYYFYKNGRYHLQGRGFIGFEEFIITDPRGNKTTYKYDLDKTKYIVGLHSVYKESEIFEESKNTNELMSFGLGSSAYVPTTIYSVMTDSSGALIAEQVEHKKYDSYGNVINQIVKTDIDSIETNNVYINNSEDWIIGQLYKSSIEYHKNGHSTVQKSVISEYDSINNQLIFKSVLAEGEIIYEESYTYDACGNQLTVTKKVGDDSRTNTVEYDGNYRLKTKYIDAENYTSTYYYNEYGVVYKETGADGLDSYYDLDESLSPYTTLRAVNSKIKVYRWSNGHVDAPDHSVYFTYEENTENAAVLNFYDIHDRKLREVNKLFNGDKTYTDWVYNKYGDLEKVSNPYIPGDNIMWSYFVYDKNGRLIKQIFPDNTVAENVYSAGALFGTKVVTTNRLGQIEESYMDSKNRLIKSVDNAGNIVEYSYDAMGNCTQIETPMTIIQMEYDAMGNRIKLIDPDCGTYQYTYNGFGEMIEQMHMRMNEVTTFEYDKIGRLVTRRSTDDNTKFTYDKLRLGLTASAINSANNSGHKYYYDEYNRMTIDNCISLGQSRSVKFKYNTYNQLYQIWYPNNLGIEYGYSHSGALATVTELNNANVVWALNSVTPLGNMTKYTLGSGIIVSREYDERTNYIKKIAHGNKIVYSYSFDALGNLLTRSDDIRNLTETFEYDNLNRLQVVKQNGVEAERIEYDPLGNIISKLSVGEFTYIEGTNKISQINETSGRSICKWDNIYRNSFNKVSCVITGTDWIEIDYGPDQQRCHAMSIKHDKYYYNKLYEEDVTNNITTQICYIYAGKTPVAIKYSTDPDFIFVHTDHLGSVIAYSKDYENIIEEFSYDVWGCRRDPSNWEYLDNLTDDINDRGFCEHEHIDMFEMINMNGRIYDPVIGRFISPDPFVQAPAIGQNFNRYAYCLNNPLKYKDETGELFFIDDFILGGIKGLFSGNFWESAKRHIANSAKIWTGLISLDSNKSFFGKTWELLSRFTYQGIQTGVGFLLSHGYNTIGNVNSVRHKYGATVLNSSSISGAVTLGSYIIGNESIKADAHNSLFQHEYGHYLQSQAMGWAYLSKVGIPSILSAIGNGEHKYKAFEQDANYRAFVYFNKYVDDFYVTESEWNISINKGRDRGWDFLNHPLVSKSNSRKYVDYHDSEQMDRLRKSLSISAKWYHYVFPIISSVTESQTINSTE